MKKYGCLGFCLILLLQLQEASSASGMTQAQQRADLIFRRLAGKGLHANDPRMPIMTQLIERGDVTAAARVAMEDEAFYSSTLKHWAALMSNRDGNPLVPYDDFQMLIIGFARDGLDARELLTTDLAYRSQGRVGNPGDFDLAYFDLIGLSFKKNLGQAKREFANGLEPAGLLTTDAWAKAHYSAGTNRRAVQYAFQEFLCAPITQWRTPNLNDRWVRRDVDRFIGKDKDHRTYQNQCRTCHAPMDAMAGAFAKVDFTDSFTFRAQDVHPKYNQNIDVFPEGRETADESWVNLLAEAHVQDDFFGWRGRTRGSGIRQFGEMISHSKAYGKCFAKRAFVEVCRREPGHEDVSDLEGVALKFEESGYKLKEIFGHVAALESCTGVESMDREIRR